MWYLPVIVGVAGGALSAVIGWLQGTEPFNPRKFSDAIIRAGLFGASVSTSFEITNEISYVVLFLAAVGIDRLGSTGAKAIRATIEKRDNGQ